MFKLFSKNKPESTEVSQEIKGYTSLEAFLARIKFIFYLAINLLLLAALATYSYSYLNKLTKESVESNRSIMVNVVTDEVLVGSLYNSPEEEKEATQIDTPEATSNTEDNAPETQTHDEPETGKKHP